MIEMKNTRKNISKVNIKCFKIINLTLKDNCLKQK